jgi:anthranilate synthase component 1
VPITSFDAVQKLAVKHGVVPVIQELFSGTETPLSIFEKLGDKKTGSFLLESAEQGVWSRYSFIGVNSRGMLVQESDASVQWLSSDGASALPGADLPYGIAALDAVELIQKSWGSTSVDEAPPLTSGLVGIIGWDAIREIENLGPARPRDFESPVLALSMFSELVVVDHLKSTVLLISNIFVEPGIDLAIAYEKALAAIAGLRLDLLKPTEVFLADVDHSASSSAQARVKESDFLASVERAKEYVRAGDVFQVVISQRFDQSTDATGLDIYRTLRALNPSPYMYLFNFEDASGEFSVIGSSPEALFQLNGKRVITHPIAGSRPRGATNEIDLANEVELRADQKESAEHLMLVDLARNDLLKVCEPSSVNVTEFMQVHRFSHIMHLVSTVEGQVLESATPVDVFKATFPAGTLSGAPKPRALEIIEELEPANRGLFGGVVGYFDFAGNADLAIAIRTAFLRNGTAHVQAGAGIVLDSNPQLEHQETIAKAGAPLRAVTLASNLTRHKP